jgi:hypothetical protein
MPSGEALALFRSLAPVTIADMAGDWRGSGIDTGHPLDALLQAAHWRGKRFEGDDARPLVHDGPFGRYELNPGLLPLGIAMRLNAGNWPYISCVIWWLGPLFATRKPRARLRMVDRDGIASAAMVYDQKPIIDHLRCVDDTRVMGLMDRRGDAAPCFFLLEQASDIAP